MHFVLGTSFHILSNNDTFRWNFHNFLHAALSFREHHMFFSSFFFLSNIISTKNISFFPLPIASKKYFYFVFPHLGRIFHSGCLFSTLEDSYIIAPAASQLAQWQHESLYRPGGLWSQNLHVLDNNFGSDGCFTTSYLACAGYRAQNMCGGFHRIISHVDIYRV